MQCCIRLWQGQPALLGRKDARSGVTVLDVQLQVRPWTVHGLALAAPAMTLHGRAEQITELPGIWYR